MNDGDKNEDENADVAQSADATENDNGNGDMSFNNNFLNDYPSAGRDGNEMRFNLLRLSHDVFSPRDRYRSTFPGAGEAGELARAAIEASEGMNDDDKLSFSERIDKHGWDALQDQWELFEKQLNRLSKTRETIQSVAEDELVEKHELAVKEREGRAVYEAVYEAEYEAEYEYDDLKSEASVQAKRSSSHELVAAADALVGLHLRSGEQHVFEPHKYASLAAKVCTGCERQEVIFSIISRSPCVCVLSFSHFCYSVFFPNFAISSMCCVCVSFKSSTSNF